MKFINKFSMQAQMAVRNIFKYRRRSMVIFVAIIFSIFILVWPWDSLKGSKRCLTG